MARTRREIRNRLSNNTHRRIDWWNEDENTAHETIFDAARLARRRNNQRRRDAIRHACLYDDSEIGYLASAFISVGTGNPSAVATNVIRKAIDTYVAITSRDKPYPLAQTDGADFMAVRRAKMLTKTMRGSLEQSGYYRQLTTRKRDAAIYGSSFALNYREGKKIHHDKVYLWEVDVLFRDAYYGSPSTLFVTRYVSPTKLDDRYPGKWDIIEKSYAKDPDDMYPIGYDDESDQRVVRMAWHLPERSDKSDGRFAVAVSEGVLYYADFTWDEFPISKLDFSPPTVGWYGEGMARQLEGAQYEVNDIGLKLSEANYMTPAFYLWVADNSTLETDELSNVPGTVIRGGAQPPLVITPQASHPDLLNYYQTMRQVGSDESGVSAMAASGHKPAGLNSGKALRLYRDSQTERFLPQSEQCEADCERTAMQHYRLLEEAYAEDKSLTVKVKGHDGIEIIPWEKVRMDLDSWVLTIKSVNFLSNSPSARVEEVEELIQGPFGFTPEEGLELLDYPDLDAIRKRKTAKRRWVEACLDKIIEAEDPDAPGVYTMPEPPMDLQLAYDMAHETYQDMRTRGNVNERTMARILDFAIDAKNELDKANAAAAPPPMPGAPPGPGAGESLPAEQPMAPQPGLPPMGGE